MKKTSYICISDIHLGHLRVNAETIYNKLMFVLYPHLTECDGLFIAGDFFDQLITMDSSGAQYATKVIQDLVTLADEYKFFIRVLRGTFSHDRQQLRLFETIGSYYKNVDLKYFDEISVENIASDNLTVLYLPDSLPDKSANVVMKRVHKLLDSNKLNKVDLIIGHGYFEHVLPPAARQHSKIVYTWDMFKSLVTGYVVFGHVHAHSAHKQVVYCGSFDRLAHGEEEAKGFLKLQRDKAWTCTFIQNDMSTPFVTVRLSEELDDVEDLLKELHTKVTAKMDVHEPGHLRIVVKDQDTKLQIIPRIPYIYPKLSVTVKVSDGAKDEPIILSTEMLECVDLGSVPTPETLVEDVKNYLEQYHPGSTLTSEVIATKLEALKGGK